MEWISKSSLKVSFGERIRERLKNLCLLERPPESEQGEIPDLYTFTFKQFSW
jgi:hypothetical protein